MKSADLKQVASLALLAADTAISKQAALLQQVNEEKAASLKQAKVVEGSLKAAGFMEDADEASAISTSLQSHSGTLDLLKNAADVIVDLLKQLHAKTAAAGTGSAGSPPATTPVGTPARVIGKAADDSVSGDVTPKVTGDYVQQNTQIKRANDLKYLQRMGISAVK